MGALVIFILGVVLMLFWLESKIDAEAFDKAIKELDGLIEKLRRVNSGNN
ncbi:hypothetical protein [Nitrosomonas communis]